MQSPYHWLSYGDRLVKHSLVPRLCCPPEQPQHVVAPILGELIQCSNIDLLPARKNCCRRHRASAFQSYAEVALYRWNLAKTAVENWTEAAMESQPLPLNCNPSASRESKMLCWAKLKDKKLQGLHELWEREPRGRWPKIQHRGETSNILDTLY